MSAAILAPKTFWAHLKCLNVIALLEKLFLIVLNDMNYTPVVHLRSNDFLDLQKITFQNIEQKNYEGKKSYRLLLQNLSKDDT